ncbi:MAG: glycosyltransferase [Oscillospiraceae bacterium]
MPVYKVERYIDRCVQSVVEQGADDFEMILVDDGSPDSCWKMCDAWTERDGRISVIHKENKGLSDARNCGVEAAVGEYCLFLDSDDSLLPKALCKIIEQLRAYRPDVLIGTFSAVEESCDKTLFERDSNLDSNRINGCDTDTVVTELRRKMVSPTAWRYVVRRGLLAENNLKFEVGLISEDAMWTPRMITAAKSYCLMDFVFYRYNIRANSIMMTKNFKRYTDIFYICESQFDYFSDRSDAQKLYVYNYLCMLLNNVLQDYREFSVSEREIVDKWFDDNKSLLRRVARAQPLIAVAAKIVGIKSSMLLFAMAVKLKNKLLQG